MIRDGAPRSPEYREEDATIIIYYTHYSSLHFMFAAMDSVLLLILFFFLTLTFYFTLISRNKTRTSKKVSLPPGSQGILPYVGESLKLISCYRTENPEPFMDERINLNKSKIFTSHLFGETTIVSADPDLNKIILAGEGKTFESSYPPSMCALLGRYSMSLMRGPMHKHMHSLSLTRFSSLSVLKDCLLPDIERLVNDCMSGWGHSSVIILADQAKKMMFDLTVKQLISHDPGEFVESLRNEYLRVIDGFFSVPLPSFLSFPFTTYGKAIQARKNVADQLRGVVRKRQEEKRMKVGGVECEEISGNKYQKMMAIDMLDELIKSDEGFTEEQMVDFLLALLVAGYETTPTVMTLVVKFVTETPQALALLKEEHDAIRARKKNESDPLEWDDYKAMRFTQCVINETLRVANIVSGVFRRATSDIHYKEYTIPKGCKVFASFRAVHMDPDTNFGDARTFNPWRWQNDDTEKCTFTPFGGGPRMCPGYELARVEISVFLHHLITLYSWEVVEQDKVVHFPTTRTLKGFPIIVHRRKTTA